MMRRTAGSWGRGSWCRGVVVKTGVRRGTRGVTRGGSWRVTRGVTWRVTWRVTRRTSGSWIAGVTVTRVACKGVARILKSVTMNNCRKICV